MSALAQSYAFWLSRSAAPFHELEKLSVLNVPQNGRHYYIHKSTWHAFCYCDRAKKWYDVSGMRDWKQVCERGDFGF